tara:strand:+ start:1537 stop:2241 length:705 start_codon:yes stop_codon:yes gene_type:complete
VGELILEKSMGHPASNNRREVVVNDRIYTTEDGNLSGRDLLSLAAFRPASDYSIVVFKDFGTRAIGLDELVNIESDEPLIFRAFKGDRLFRALLNEREVLWGDEEISSVDLRAIGHVQDDQDLFLDSDGDRSIDDDGRVRLKKDGVERIRSGEPKDETVDIILNGEMISVDKGRLTFGELARLAFPDLFGRDQICFTVSFSRGPKRRREGVLLEGGKVRVVVGMVFNVSATDKS